MSVFLLTWFQSLGETSAIAQPQSHLPTLFSTIARKKIKWVLSSLRKRTRQISFCECFAFKLISVTWRNFNFSANMCSLIFCSAHAIHLFVKKFNPPASKTRRPFAFKYLNTTSVILKIFVLFLFRSQFLFVVIC